MGDRTRLEGGLDAFGLLEVLQWLEHRGEPTLLVAWPEVQHGPSGLGQQAGPERLLVSCEQGLLGSVRLLGSGMPEALRIGQWLLGRDVIDVRGLRYCLAVQARMGPRARPMLGALARRSGLVGAAELEDAIRDLARAQLVRACGWRAGRFRVLGLGGQSPKRMLDWGVSVEEAVLAVAQDLDEAAKSGGIGVSGER